MNNMIRIKKRIEKIKIIKNYKLRLVINITIFYIYSYQIKTMSVTESNNLVII